MTMDITYAAPVTSVPLSMQVWPGMAVAVLPLTLARITQDDPAEVWTRSQVEIAAQFKLSANIIAKAATDR